MSSATWLDFVTVDVFSLTPYLGNQLAIVRIPPGLVISQAQKQVIAREFNFSETTFLHEKDQNSQENVWAVDIFATTQEIPFARHPTIGTACYVLRKIAQERGINDGLIEASFTLKAGPVALRYDVTRKATRAAMPHNVHVHTKRCTRDELFERQPRLADAHHQGQIQVNTDFSVVSIVKDMTFILVKLESVEALGLVSLASGSLTTDGLDKGWDNTFIATYFFVRTGKSETSAITLRTRMIYAGGEDAASGSAANDLAAYLALSEGRPGETLKYNIVQGVEMGRQSKLFIEVVLAEDKSISQLFQEGAAVQVMEGRVRM